MDGIIPKVPYGVKRLFLKNMRRCRDAGRQRRYLVILNLLNGRPASEVAEVVRMSPGSVYRIARRFSEHGEIGLYDRREDNGDQKLGERYLAILDKVVRSNPLEHAWRQATWTRERLVKTMADKTGVRVHVGTMSRALRMIQARRGRPRPRVRCPWRKKAKNKRIRQIRRLANRRRGGEVVVYVDEVDIHLNPKIGLDWMGRGQQKEVMTPGKNEKRYLAGAKNAKTGQLTWVEGERKDSMLFIRLLHELRKQYPHATKIHVVLDNFRIHSSDITKAVVTHLGGRIVLHFLPPYCPDENKIERLWQDLHAAVTRNHCCPDIETLMREVRRFMRHRDSESKPHHLRKAA